MTEAEYLHKLDEIDRLPNSSGIALEPGRIWILLGEIAH